MNFSDEPLVNKHIPDFSVKGWFLLKFLYKAYYSSPAVSRSIAGCFCKEIDGKYPQGKGVEKII